MNRTDANSTSPGSSHQNETNNGLPENQPQQQAQKGKAAGDGGFFASEKKGVQKGVLGGIAMMIIAVVWFVAGYAAGYIFYYPPILFVIGLYAFIKGLITGNIRGEKADQFEGEIPVPTDTFAVRTFSNLFDTERFGLNYYVGVGILLASILTLFTWMAIELIRGNPASYSLLPMNYYILIFAFNILTALFFVILVHRLSRDWSITLFFGLGLILIGIGQRFTLGSLHLQDINFGHPLDISSLIFSFLWGIFFIFGLIFAVKTWGAQLWSFMLGMVLSLFVHALLIQLYYVLQGSSFFVVGLIPSILNGIVYGGFIFAGLALYLRRKGFRLIRGEVVQLNTESN